MAYQSEYSRIYRRATVDFSKIMEDFESYIETLDANELKEFYYDKDLVKAYLSKGESLDDFFRYLPEEIITDKMKRMYYPFALQYANVISPTSFIHMSFDELYGDNAEDLVRDRKFMELYAKKIQEEPQRIEKLGHFYEILDYLAQHHMDIIKPVYDSYRVSMATRAKLKDLTVSVIDERLPEDQRMTPLIYDDFKNNFEEACNTYPALSHFDITKQVVGLDLYSKLTGRLDLFKKISKIALDGIKSKDMDVLYYNSVDNMDDLATLANDIDSSEAFREFCGQNIGKVISLFKTDFKNFEKSRDNRDIAFLIKQFSQVFAWENFSLDKIFLLMKKEHPKYKPTLKDYPHPLPSRENLQGMKDFVDLLIYSLSNNDEITLNNRKMKAYITSLVSRDIKSTRGLEAMPDEVKEYVYSSIRDQGGFNINNLNMLEFRLRELLHFPKDIQEMTIAPLAETIFPKFVASIPRDSMDIILGILLKKKVDLKELLSTVDNPRDLELIGHFSEEAQKVIIPNLPNNLSWDGESVFFINKMNRVGADLALGHIENILEKDQELQFKIARSIRTVEEFRTLPDRIKRHLDLSTAGDEDTTETITEESDPYTELSSPELYEIYRYMRKNELEEIDEKTLREKDFLGDPKIKKLLKEENKDLENKLVEYSKQLDSEGVSKKEKGRKMSEFSKSITRSLSLEVIKDNIQGLEEEVKEEPPKEEAKGEKPASIDMSKYGADIIEFRKNIKTKTKLKHLLWTGAQRPFKGKNHTMVLALPESLVPKGIREISIKDRLTPQEEQAVEERGGVVPEETLNKSAIDTYIKESNHPRVPDWLTVGWVRYTLVKDISGNPDDNRVWIDEIQTDLSNVLGKDNLSYIYPMDQLMKFLMKTFIKYIRNKGYEELILPNYNMANKLYHRGNPPKSIYTQLPSKLKFRKEEINDIDNKVDGETVWVLSNKRVDEDLHFLASRLNPRSPQK